MPVQDNDDKRTTDQPAVDAEEELRRKQAQAQEQRAGRVRRSEVGQTSSFSERKGGASSEPNRLP